MSNTKDYTITTLSNNLNQRNGPIFSLGGNNTISLRERYAPYTVVQTPDNPIKEENIKKFPYGCVTGST